MTESEKPAASVQRRLSGGAKLAVDMGPLAVFMIAYFLGGRIVPAIGALMGETWCLRAGAEMYLAVGLFLPSFFIAFAYSAWAERRVAPMLLVTGVIVGALGALTLVLHDKTFFYMKPTIVYALFAAVLAAGLATGRNFLRIVFDGALHLPDAAWVTLTRRYAVFFAVLAVANEIAWRWLTKDCPPDVIPPAVASQAWGWLLGDCDADAPARCAGEANWVRLKVFGFTIAGIVFTAFQAPFLVRHMPDEAKTTPEND